MKASKLFEFLYGESQVQGELDAFGDDLALMFEEAGKLEVSQTELSKALKALDIEAELSEDPRGFIADFTDEDAYAAAKQKLTEPDGMHKLAELGWVAFNVGDYISQSEPDSYKIRFLQITTAETGDSDKASETPEEILKKGREADQTPMDREADNKIPKADPAVHGKAKPKDGEAAKDARSTKESKGKEAKPTKESLSETVSKQVQRSVAQLKVDALLAEKSEDEGAETDGSPEADEKCERCHWTGKHAPWCKVGKDKKKTDEAREMNYKTQMGRGQWKGYRPSGQEHPGKGDWKGPVRQKQDHAEHGRCHPSCKDANEHVKGCPNYKGDK